jgi:D-sedoheptulose 7-phosphate isomerase
MMCPTCIVSDTNQEEVVDLLSKIEDHLNLVSEWKSNVEQLRLFSELILTTKNSFKAGGKIIFIGNGGSAAEASHLAAEFVGKCAQNSIPLPALALADSTPQLTAISNDFGFDQTFLRGLKAHAKPVDVVILLSTSGESRNIINSLDWLESHNITSSLWTSSKCNLSLRKSNYTLIAPTDSTPRAQELHLLLGHILAEEIEKDYLE